MSWRATDWPAGSKKRMVEPGAEGSSSPPDFFIVGAARSGTTSLHEYLRAHPRVFMPADLNKEPGYYSDLTGVGERAAYLALFQDAGSGQLRGESSTAYLTDPASAARIRRDLPDAHLIILLRNPVDRAYSLYRWMTAEGYEWISTFEGALRAEAKRASSERFRQRCPQYLYNYLYFSSGLYADQVGRFFDEFGRERVLVRLFEDFVGDPSGVLAEVCAFLGVEQREPEGFQAHNPSRTALLPPLQTVLRRVNDRVIRFGLAAGDSKSARDRIVRLGLLGRAPRPMRAATRARLRRRYRDDILKLQDLLNRDLGNWLGSPESPD